MNENIGSCKKNVEGVVSFEKHTQSATNKTINNSKINKSLR